MSNFPCTAVPRTALILVLAATVAACGGSGREAEPAPMNVAPTVAAISDRTLNQDATDSGVTFGIADADGDVGSLQVSVSSSDPVLIPAEGLMLGGSGANRTLSITPAESAAGSATVTVSVRDAQGLTANRAFNVTVQRLFTSFIRFAAETFVQPEEGQPRAMVGFTLDDDADEIDAPFESLLQ